MYKLSVHPVYKKSYKWGIAVVELNDSELDGMNYNLVECLHIPMEEFNKIVNKCNGIFDQNNVGFLTKEDGKKMVELLEHYIIMKNFIAEDLYQGSIFND